MFFVRCVQINLLTYTVNICLVTVALRAFINVLTYLYNRCLLLRVWLCRIARQSGRSDSKGKSYDVITNSVRNPGLSAPSYVTVMLLCLLFASGW